MGSWPAIGAWANTDPGRVLESLLDPPHGDPMEELAPPCLAQPRQFGLAKMVEIAERLERIVGKQQ